MDEITKIIEGYNAEKEILTRALVALESFSYTSTQERAKIIHARLVVLDSKISALVIELTKQSLCTPPIQK